MIQSCPECGSARVTTHTKLDILDGAGTDRSIVTRVRDLSRKSEDRLRFDGKNMADWCHDRRVWVRRVLTVDRDTKRISECVTDSKTGEVIYAYDEPLGKHKGRGSARGKGSVSRGNGPG